MIQCRLMSAMLILLMLVGRGIFAGETSTFDLHTAIAQAQAGTTLHVPEGSYQGPVILDKAITIVGVGKVVIDGQQSGDVIRITASDVTVRNVVIRGTGVSLDQENAGITVLAPRACLENITLEDVLFGIYLKQAPDSIIRGNRIGGKQLDVARRGDGIRLWYSPGCVIEDNTVKHSRDVVMWFSDHVKVLRNKISYGRYGLHFMYSDGNVLEDNLLMDNSVGAFLMYSSNLTLRRNRFIRNRGPSGYGIGLKDMDGIDAQNNSFLANRIGIYLDNSPSSVDVHQVFQKNVVAYNDIGIAFQPAVKRNRFINNNFTSNIEQVAVLGGGQFTGNEFTFEGQGNFWSDYAGFDQNGDGVGDLPYRSESLFENLMDRQPKLRLFLFSPAQQAVELAAEAMPAFKPRPKLTDTAPKMEPVPIAIVSVVASARWPMMLVAMLLSGVCGMVLMMTAGRAHVSSGKSRHVSSSMAMPAHDMPLLCVSRLSKAFGKYDALRNMTFEVNQGQAIALWGANGAGKTTAIRCILGLIRGKGQIEIAGYDVRYDGKRARNLIGYVPQELAFYDDWRADDMLSFYAQIKRVPHSRIAEVLAEVGLSEHRRKRVAALSGGMKQRLALAAALLADPPLLVLDEITSNLDAEARHDLVYLLQKLRAANKAILFTSHRLEEVQALADQVIVLQRGEVKFTCDPGELAEVLGLRVKLHMVIEKEEIDMAVNILKRGGIAAQRNGIGLYVDVNPDRNAMPIDLLARKGITVRSFSFDNSNASHA